MITTGRLRIFPAARGMMEETVSSEKDPELRQAYSEMLNCCLCHPDQWEWYAMWVIELAGGERVGDLCFKGLDENGVAEIGYGILEGYRGRGYATEAVAAACRWAFGHAEVRSLEAETDEGNTASQRVLEKCGFRRNGTCGEEGPRFTLTRPDILSE